MDKPIPPQKSYAIDFVVHRQIVGWLGVAMPLLIGFGTGIAYGSLPPSISASYHTGMRNVFVGILFVLGAFLASYLGYRKNDRTFSIVAGVCAFIVALCPTSDRAPGMDVASASVAIGRVHVGAAAILFAALALISLVEFTQTAGTQTPKKKHRDRWYRGCAACIFVCLGIIGLCKALHYDRMGPLPTVFVLESVMIWAFGSSWLIKGEFMLKDD